MADLYSLVHVEVGPLATFLTREEADDELDAVLRDEPSWAGDLWVQPFTVLASGNA